MFTSLPDLQSAYDQGSVTAPMPKHKEKFTFKEEPTFNKTKSEEDREMFFRYWRYVRKYRRQRNFQKAFYWLGEMKKLKRFMTTTKEERFPEVYLRCHKVISFMFNNGCQYGDVADITGANPGTVKSILHKVWRGISEDYVTQIYNELLPEARKRGYDGE